MKRILTITLIALSLVFGAGWNNVYNGSIFELAELNGDFRFAVWDEVGNERGTVKLDTLLANCVSYDKSPQLNGDLDVNGNNIVNSSSDIFKMTTGRIVIEVDDSENAFIDMGVGVDGGGVEIQASNRVEIGDHENINGDLELIIDVLDSVVIVENGNLQVNGYSGLRKISNDPPNPIEGNSVMWQSDGTGSGDNGDIMIKITAGGTTKTVTLIDFSAI